MGQTMAPDWVRSWRRVSTSTRWTSPSGARGGRARGLARRHRGGDLLGRLVHVATRGDAAAAHEQVADRGGRERPVGDVEHDLALRPVAGAGDGVGEAPVAVGLLEHVVAAEATALGDADHLRDVVEPRAGMLGADARDRGPHLVATLELGRGQVVGIGRVDAPAQWPPRNEHAPG